MAPNQHRSTAGKTLIAFAILASVIAGFTAYLRATRTEREFTAYTTGLGDQDLYKTDLGPGFDIFQPNLVFDGMPDEFAPGLFRRNHRPVRLQDHKARQIAREKGDRHWVYAIPSKDGKSARFYLKFEDDAYIEFGKQKYFPEPGDTRPGVQLIPRD